MSIRSVYVVALCVFAAVCGCARNANETVSFAIEHYRAAIAQRKTATAASAASGATFLTVSEEVEAPKSRFASRLPSSQSPSSSPAAALPEVKWDEFKPRFDRYVDRLPGSLWEDAKAVATNRFSLVTLVAAGVGGLAASGGGYDKQVEDHYTKRGGNLNKFWDSTGGFAGSPAIHLPLAGAAVLGSMAIGNEEYQTRSETMLNALAITGITTLAMKGAFRTESPNGDPMGWPSGHSSSSFCLATVLYHQYGPWVGVPMLGFASFVAYQRVDARNHDLSDVISGSLIGIAIGHGVAAAGQPKLLGMDVIPYYDPQSKAVGVALYKQW